MNTLVITSLLFDLSSDCKDKGVLSVDWYVAPLINPDGYEYTHTNQRYWRKNR